MANCGPEFALLEEKKRLECLHRDLLYVRDELRKIGAAENDRLQRQTDHVNREWTERTLVCDQCGESCQPSKMSSEPQRVECNVGSKVQLHFSTNVDLMQWLTQHGLQ